MPKIKPSRAYAAEKINAGFGGISDKTLLSPKNAADIRNFRISPDGALVTREGYRSTLVFPHTVRALCEEIIDGVLRHFAVAGSIIYSFDPDAGTSEEVGYMLDTTGKVSFFRFAGDLYIIGNGGCRVYNPSLNSFTAMTPYIPLIGIGWHPTQWGESNEQPNLMTPYLRIQYRNVSDTTVFVFPYFAKSIKKLYVNGIATTSYVFTPNSDRVTVPSAGINDSVEVCIETMLNTALREELYDSTDGFVYTSKGKDTLLLFGAPDTTHIFYGSTVTNEMMSASSRFDSRMKPLYFLKDHILMAGSNVLPPHTVCPFYDDLLIFNDVQTWLAYRTDGEEMDAIPVLNGIGCSSPRAAVLCGDTPVTVTKNGVFRLNATATHPEEIKAARISAPVERRFSQTFPTDAVTLWRPETGELWIRSVSDTDGTVWIWHKESDRWYRFTNVYADVFFPHTGGLAFSEDMSLYQFDDTLSTDDGEPVTTRYESGWFDFSRPETVRKAVRASLTAKTGGGTFSLTLSTERASHTFSLTGTVRDAPEQFDCRFSSGRYRFVRFVLTGGGNCRQTVYALSFYTNL